MTTMAPFLHYPHADRAQRLQGMRGRMTETRNERIDRLRKAEAFTLAIMLTDAQEALDNLREAVLDVLIEHQHELPEDVRERLRKAVGRVE